MERKIIVVTAAFGAEVVHQAGGQRYFIPIISRSGADGVEIRRELLSSAIDEELADLRLLIEEQGLFSYYSVPEPLFSAPGTINPQLKNFQREAALLNAQAIKFALGSGAGTCSTEQLAKQLAYCRIPLLVENDQTATGKIQPMLDYFNHHDALSTVQGMTFDMANWLWVDESPIKAAEQLAPYIAYCHVKAAVKTKGSWQAISLDQSQDEWRTLLAMIPDGVPLGIEFPLEGRDIAERVHYFIGLLRAA